MEWSSIRTESWVALAATVAMVVVALGLSVRLAPPWRRAVRCAIVLVILRVALFGNPFAWDLYARVLTPEEIGWRQYDVVVEQRDAYLEPPAAARYLAVGSSQTGRIYDTYARRRADLGSFVIAGMNPVDLYLYRDEIVRRSPRTVLLYLSGFDLAREPPGNGMVTAPAQGAGLFRFWAALRSTPGGRDYDATVAEMALGEISPEAKYGFVLRGLVDRGMGAIAGRARAVERSSPRASRDRRVEWLRESFDERTIDLNVAFLERFVEHVDRLGIAVEIVEGRYSPRVADPRIRRIEDRVAREIRRVADRFDRVRYHRSDGLVPLGADDFDDLTHVTHEVGERLARAVFARLEGRPELLAFNPAAEPTARDRAWWRERVRNLDLRLRQSSGARVLFLGDSITAGWEANGREVWRRVFEPLGAVNLGIGSDRTEHLLWRIREAPLDAVAPDVVVVLIGTNNLVRKSQTADEIAGGVAAVVEAVHARLPAARIVVHPVFPRGTAADPLRPKLADVNRAVTRLADLPFVEVVDVGDRLLDADGHLSLDHAEADRLHLDAGGYEAWAAALEPTIVRILGQTP